MSDFKYEEYAVALGYQALYAVAVHPLAYADFLMMIRHNPIPGYPMRTFFGLRNYFKYIGHIQSTDGFFGIYRGVAARIRATWAITTSGLVFKHHYPDYRVEYNEDDPSFHTYINTLWKNIVLLSIGVVASHPFIVICWRVMGQFVGREEIYSSFFWSIEEIYSRNGITGFFTGLVPRWLGAALAHTLADTISYLINCYVLENAVHRSIIRLVVKYYCHSFTSPLTEAAVCYAVNDSGLECGQPPRMPIFHDWIEALAFTRKPRITTMVEVAMVEEQ